MRSSVHMRVLLLAVAMMCFAFTALAQATAADREAENNRIREQRLRESARRQPSELPPWARPTSSRPAPPAPKRKMTEEHKQRLYPSAVEKERFATFLRQPRTGLVRLLQLGDCEEDQRVVQVGHCLDAIPPVPGGGTFYSFASGSHRLRELADLWLKGDVFRAGFAGSVLGVLAVLGDVPLESVEPESPGVKYLSTLSPPSSLDEASKQYLRNARGFQESAHTYGMTAPVRPDSTYVLRSITYKFGDELDKRRKLDDVLIAFRVVATTADGSVTLLWKELRRAKTPKIKKYIAVTHRRIEYNL